MDILRRFLQTYGSPLSSYAQDFIQIGDDTNIEWTLLPAISLVESGGGKKECGKFNPFGWGSPCWDFVDYSTAIRAIANSISSSPTYGLYQKTKQLADLAEVYNAADVVSWEKNVTYFQEKIRSFQ